MKMEDLLLEENDYYEIENASFDKFTIRHPFRMVASGPTSTGKTQFIFKLLQQRENIFDPKIEQVIYLYAEWQSCFSDFKKNVTFSTDLKLLNIYPKKSTLIIIDDLLSKLSGSIELQELFTQRSHHRGISVILVSQNIFSQGPIFRTVKLNATHYYLTKHNTDLLQLSYFGRQIEPPGHSKRFSEAYYIATNNREYGGLFITLDSKCRDIEKYVMFESEDFTQPTFILAKDLVQNL